MLLKDELVEVKVNSKTCQYYLDLGYSLPTHKNSRGKVAFSFGETIKVKPSDLKPSSNIKVKVKCDYCGKVYEKRYVDHVKKDKDACVDCTQKAREEKMMIKYGCLNPMHVAEFKENLRKTCVEKYGTEYAIQNESVRQKAKETLKKNYGVDAPIQNPQIREKINNTCRERYGTDYPFGSEKITKKIEQTLQAKYGVDHISRLPEINNRRKSTLMEKYGEDNPMKIPEFRAKQMETMYLNGSQKCSTQQKYLFDLYGGEINYPLSKFFLDIYIPNDNIDIEFNGGGHNLCVKIGSIENDEFLKNERIRSIIIRRNGIRQLTIVSPEDLLPSDKILLQMYSESLSYFNTTNHTWRTYDIDKGIFMDAEHKDGESYDFGDLRKIQKQTD